MLYTDNYQMNLPQTSDAVRVEDFNENTTAIDGLLAGMEISDTTAAEIWGCNNVPDNATISGAFSKIAQTVPSAIGTPGTLLMAGTSEANWGKNRSYYDLIEALTINHTGNLNWICDVPTGWSVETLEGIYIEVDLTIIGAYNNEDSARSCGLKQGTIGTGYIYFPSDEVSGYDATSVTTVSLRKAFMGAFRTGDEMTIAGEYVQNGGSSYSTFAAGYLTVDDDLVTAISSAGLGFYQNGTYDYSPYCVSCTGTGKYYAVRSVG